jgi:tetratricopeptide (TPR) repeat protein
LSTIKSKQSIEWETLIGEVASLFKQGHYDRAVVVANNALRVAEQAWPDQTPVATSLGVVARMYDAQGQYEQIEPLLKRALAIYEKVLGQDHPNVAICLNNLAELYDNQGKFAQAEPLYQRSLVIREKALGPDHPDVATSLNNLALLYKTKGQYAQAEPLYNRSLAIRVKALAPDHPDVASSLYNLSELYRAQSLYAQAEQIDKRSSAISGKTLGSDYSRSGMVERSGINESERRKDFAMSMVISAVFIIACITIAVLIFPHLAIVKYISK